MAEQLRMAAVSDAVDNGNMVRDLQEDLATARTDALREALGAVKNMRLPDDVIDREDTAHNEAIDQALAAIEALITNKASVAGIPATEQNQ